MQALKDIGHAYGLAHRLIWRDRIWPVMVVPVLLTALYLPFVIAGGLWLSDAVSRAIVDALPWLAEHAGWVLWPMRIIGVLLSAVLGYMTFRIVVMLFYSPILEFVAEKVEAHVLGAKVDDPKRWYAMIGRVLLIVAVTLSLAAVLAVLSLLVSLVPVIGPVIVLAAIFPLQLFLTAVGYLDPYLDRRGYSVRGSLRLLRRRFFTLVLFELGGTALLLLPVIGWFLGPTYSVVAGIALAIRIEQAEKVQPPGNPRTTSRTRSDQFCSAGGES